MLPSPTKERCKEEKEIQLTNNRRGKQHQTDWKILFFVLVESTDPSLGDTLLLDIEQFLKNAEEKSHQISVKGETCFDSESDTSTIMNEEISHKVAELEETFNGNLEENLTINNSEIKRPSGYNSTQYAQADQLHSQNNENVEDIDHQANVLKLKIAGNISTIM